MIEETQYKKCSYCGGDFPIDERYHRGCKIRSMALQKIDHNKLEILAEIA